MDKLFLKNILSVPNPSKHEDLLAKCIENWCKAAGVKCRRDGRGNMYLTKGSPSGGGFYPGMTAHLDSVIGSADGMMNEVLDAVENQRLLEIREEGGKIKAYLDDKPVVTGCDDKNAVAIALSMLDRLPRLKVALYVEEELGMQGSRASDFSFWDDVCWVLGFDSPGGNRATHSSSGTILYSDEFFEAYLKPACSKHGVTSFNHEPYTDIKLIREKTGLETFNCRNGGIGCHSTDEYADFDTVCDSEELAYELLTTVPTNKRHVTDVKRYEPPKPSWWREEIRPGAGGLGGYGTGAGTLGGYGTGERWWERWTRSSEKPNRASAETIDVEVDDEPLSPMEHSDDDEASIYFKFDELTKMTDFMERLDKIELPVDMEDTYDGVTVSGKLRALKKAYAIYYAFEHGRPEQSFVYLTNHDMVDDFWRTVVFDDMLDDGAYDKFKNGDDIEDVDFEMK